MSSQLVVSRLASRQASLMYASGAQVNLFENESHAILNPYNHDLKEMSKQGQTPTAFNQGIIRWEVPKFEDCFKTGFFELRTNAATQSAAGGAPLLSDEALVNHFGYVAFRRMYIQLTNNPYTAEFEIPYFMYDRHHNKYNARQFLDFIQPSMLSGAPAVVRQAALTRGHTALIPLEVGQAYEGFENMFWISPLAHNMMIYAQLANASDVIEAPTVGASTAIGNLNTIIADVKLFLSMNTVDDDARANAIAVYNSDDGLYNMVREPRLWQFDIPQAVTSGVVSLDMEETRAFSAFTIFYESNFNTVTAWRKSPFDIGGLSRPAGDGANTLIHFTDFELVSLGGETIIKKRNVLHHLEFEQRERFVDREANLGQVNVSLSVYDPLKDNTINGALDPNVYNKIRLNLYFGGWPISSRNAAALPANVSTTPAGAGARVTIMFHTHNFVHNSHADANKVIA